MSELNSQDWLLSLVSKLNVKAVMRANVIINNTLFFAGADGHKDSLEKYLTDVIAKVKGKVEPDYLPTAAINEIIADGQDYYGYLQLTNIPCDFPDNEFNVTIEEDGSFTIDGSENIEKDDVTRSPVRPGRGRGNRFNRPRGQGGRNRRWASRQITRRRRPRSI